jgi:hypothetical protein
MSAQLHVSVLFQNEVPVEPDDLKGVLPFSEVVYRGTPWDLSHLKPFSFLVTVPGHAAPLRVVVLFSCHCFTRDETDAEKASSSVDPADQYSDERESRILDEERYLLSKAYLPQLVKDLATRKITVADEKRKNGNFVTLELNVANAQGGYYSVFFEVEKERQRKLKLRVQSAYLRQQISKREAESKPVKLLTILKATFENRKIRP